MASEINFISCRGSDDPKTKNLALARSVIRQVFASMEADSLEEQEQYSRAGLVPAPQKSNRWATYTDKGRQRTFMTDSLEFVRNHAECRMRELSEMQLRFLVLLQHLVVEDTHDFYRPESLRKHQDAFEGILTQSVNSQLIKDAHRSEWSVDGSTFSLQEKFASGKFSATEDRKLVIARFQQELVKALEEHLLGFCKRRGLSELSTRQLLQAVTTQMSQCGLANLDRSSQAAKYFVSGQGLDQRTAYSLSTMDAGALGECLKLSLLCMKTGFSQYHTEETLGLGSRVPAVSSLSVSTLQSCSVAQPVPVLESGPKSCRPTSYLYQYATLRFAPGSCASQGAPAECVVIDALDEVHIEPW
jgi:hypothetical protein